MAKSLLEEILEGLTKDRDGVLETGTAKELVALDSKINRVKAELKIKDIDAKEPVDPKPPVKKSWL